MDPGLWCAAREAAPGNPGPLPAKAFPKANLEPRERTVQASPALSRRWAGPRGPSCVLSPLSSRTAAWSVHTGAVPDTHTRDLTPVQVHAHAGLQMCTSLLLTPQVPTGLLRPADLVSRAANSMELPGLRDPQNSGEVFQSPAGTHPPLLTQVESNTPRGPGLSRARTAKPGSRLHISLEDWGLGYTGRGCPGTNPDLTRRSGPAAHSGARPGHKAVRKRSCLLRSPRLPRQPSHLPLPCTG